MSDRKGQRVSIPHRSTEMFRRLLKKDGEGNLDGFFARRVCKVRMCSLDARGVGPVQATLKLSKDFCGLAWDKARPYARTVGTMACKN